VDRIYHTWDEWECFRAGFFEVRAPKGMTDEQCIDTYATLLRDISAFKTAMIGILNDWPNSVRHNLTNERMNRIAWMGQSALCYNYRIPARYRGGYNLLTDEEKQAADQAALDIINLWMECEGYPLYDQESIKSKTEANLY
jgi:hypothetical protein